MNYINLATKLILGLFTIPKSKRFVSVNFAHHNAAGNKRWTVAMYAAAVRMYFSQRTVASGRIVWIESVPAVTSYSHFSYDYKDWRTTHRMILYGRAFNRELQATTAQNIYVVRMHDILQPISDATPDGAHYTFPAAQDVAADAILDALCRSACEDIIDK